ncbi:MAG: Uma2 family endonuclease [Dolichospermum sp. DET50]|jgi:Uma2 family endonuclease|nr:Uma2 family endonuclease [Dolichospermum sp. DET66]MBS3034857.1 Uma2 family endonuclease [Dolichospermum sp. DET67]MBS3040060.1 Uma2 family endonuclease [Dolichospermum sp. DET50]QSX67238.1 MAG: Uma2 family endonuclease [Dolichospermum sp. DET69]
MTQVMESSLALPSVEQRFFCAGVTWERFQVIQKSFENVPGVRLFYCQGVLEIVSIGKLHELISHLIGLLLGQYFLDQEIEFFPSGSYSQIIPGIVEYQADLSYCLGTDKSRPDLCIEVVVTSGSPIKLEKYKLMAVPEVWFWEDGTLAVYCLRSAEYEKIVKSELLPDLDLNLFNRCLLMSSPLEAVKEFRRHLGTEAIKN